MVDGHPLLQQCDACPPAGTVIAVNPIEIWALVALFSAQCMERPFAAHSVKVVAEGMSRLGVLKICSMVLMCCADRLVSAGDTEAGSDSNVDHLCRMPISGADFVKSVIRRTDNSTGSATQPEDQFSRRISPVFKGAALIVVPADQATIICTLPPHTFLGPVTRRHKSACVPCRSCRKRTEQLRASMAVQAAGQPLHRPT